MVATRDYSFALAALARCVGTKGCCFGEHCTTFVIEMAGNGIDDINQPTGRCTKALCTGSNAAVKRSFVAFAHLPSKALND